MNEELFSNLIDDTKLLKKVLALGFSTATPIQSQSIPVILSNKDIVAQAQTGSGKTLAYLIPLAQKLSNLSSIEKTFALIITPTRELALQVEQVFCLIAPEVNANILIGGMDFDKQKLSYDKDSRVVIGTPGRILDFLKQKALDLSSCEYFVLDEADEMLSMGFIDDVKAILAKLPKKRQGLFVSATISPRIEMLAQSFLDKPIRISVADQEELTPNITHQYLEVDLGLMAKPQALSDLIEVLKPRSAIIFCNTKSDTKLVEVFLRRRGFNARRINSDLTQSQRDRVMKKIREEGLRFLVATDIAARGIDIEQIDYVINYNIHEQGETYVHRTGRTGRAGRSGTAISLIGPKDWGIFHHIKKVLNYDFQKLELPSEAEIANARLNHLDEILQNTEINEKELLLAQKILENQGDLIKRVAKLSKFTLEHFVNLEEKSLDEENIEERNLERSSEQNNEKRRRKDKKEEYHKKPKHSSPPDRKTEHKADKKTEHREREEKILEEVRVYISQGIAQGMNERLFADLAASHANLEENNFNQISFRQHYGWLDLREDFAKKLIKDMNGIEYNGNSITLEFACVLSNRGRHGSKSSTR